jgi:hypothetical protein
MAGGGLTVELFGASLPVPVCRILIFVEIDVDLGPLHPAFFFRLLVANQLVTRSGVEGRRILRRKEAICWSLV